MGYQAPTTWGQHSQDGNSTNWVIFHTFSFSCVIVGRIFTILLLYTHDHFISLLTSIFNISQRILHASPKLVSLHRPEHRPVRAVVHIHCWCSNTAGFAVVCFFLLSTSLAHQDPSFSINPAAWVSTCYYNDSPEISHALSHHWSLLRFISFMKIEKWGHHPQSRWVLTYPWSFCWRVTRVRIPASECARGQLMSIQCRTKPMTSNGTDLLGITETWKTVRETSAHLAEVTPHDISFQIPRAHRRGGFFVSSAHRFTSISLPTETSCTSGKLECGQPQYYQHISPTWSCYSSLHQVARYIVLHGFTPSWSGSDGGLQTLYRFITIRRETAHWYFGIFWSGSICQFPYTHWWSFSWSYDFF